MSDAVELLMGAVAGDSFRSAEDRQLELKRVVEGIEASTFDFSELIEHDSEVEQSLTSADETQRKIYSFFCNVSENHSVMRARERVNFLLWSLVDDYDVAGLDVEDSQVLVSAIRECEYFIPALLSAGASYMKP